MARVMTWLVLYFVEVCTKECAPILSVLADQAFRNGGVVSGDFLLRHSCYIDMLHLFPDKTTVRRVLVVVCIMR
jgi:hypothetical protein